MKSSEEKKQKMLLGKLLGEVYRLQNVLGGIENGADEAKVFALLNGFESVIDEEIVSEMITNEDIENTMKIFDLYWNDTEKLKEFKGFYDIEYDLKEKGINRGKAIRIFTYLKANNQYIDIIEKMDSGHSPIECKRFEISKWYK